MTDIIRFPAQIYKIQTLVDGGIRISLDLSEIQTDVAKQLMDARIRGGLIDVAVIPLGTIIDSSAAKQDENNNDKIPARSEWQP